jgi:hypothetical protein
MKYKKTLLLLVLSLLYLFPVVRPLSIQAAVRCAVIFITFEGFPCDTDCAFLICNDGSGAGVCRQGLCFA